MKKYKLTHSSKPSTPELVTPLDALTVCPRLCSKDLFASSNEVIIEHLGEQYRLRLTRQGKLILTK